MLARSVMEITGDTAPFIILGFEQSPSHIKQRLLSISSPISLNEQTHNQKGLRDDEHSNADDAPAILLPCGRNSVFHNTASREITLRKSPSLQLPPVEHVDTGSRRFQHNVRWRFAAKNLCGRIRSQLTGSRPIHDMAANKP